MVLMNHTAQVTRNKTAPLKQPLAQQSPPPPTSDIIDLHFERREELGDILHKNNMEVGVEIGVQAGLFAEKILERWKHCKVYVLVDLWQHQENYKDVANKDSTQQNLLYESTLRRLKRFEERGVQILVCRNYSTICVHNFRKQYFDFIYVDARHDFKGVYEDLTNWWPKLKQNGIMAGHDYVTQDEGPQQSKQDWTLNYDGTIDLTRTVVKGAVNKFAALHGLTITTSKEAWPSWAAQKLPSNITPPHQIVLATWSNRDLRSHQAQHLVNTYAKRHNYTRTIDSTRRMPQYPAPWEKIMLTHVLLTTNDKNDKTPDVIVMIDDDAFVLQQNITVEYWLQQHTDADVIIGQEKNGVLNTGLMIVRNTDWSRQFFKTMLQDPRCRLTQPQCCWEQDCFNDIITGDNLTARVATVPSNIFNCQLQHKSYVKTCEPWVYHVMGGILHRKSTRLSAAIQKLSLATNLSL